jgi:hypothetical protein
MEAESLDDVFRNLNEQLTSLESTTHRLITQFNKLSREVEALKVEILELILENKRASQARSLGFTAMKGDHRKLGLGIALAIGQSFLQAAVDKDSSSAIAAGISGFNHFSQGLGDSRWAVSLDSQFIIVPRDGIFAGHVWVTWESLQNALQELRQDTTRGEKLENLGVVIAKLRDKKHKLVRLLIPVVETSQSQWHPVRN